MAAFSIDEGQPYGYGQASVGASAIGLPTLPSSANSAIIGIESQGDCRWRDDGVAPTASLGNYLFAGNNIVSTNQKSLANFQIISVSGATVTLNANYYLR
jgi:hypothetical protein